MKSIARFCLLLSIFTASWDIRDFFCIDIFGKEIRYLRFFIFVSFAIFFAISLQRGTIYLKKHLTIILLWFAASLLSIFKMPLFFDNVEYMIRIALSILTIYVIIFFYGDRKHINTLLRVYVFSFVFAAMVAIIQFILGQFGIVLWEVQGIRGTGIKDLGITEIRSSGFSIEASHFASCIIPGFFLIGYLKNRRTNLFSRQAMNVFFCLILIALVLSVSRLAWLFIGLFFLYQIMFEYTFIKKVVAIVPCIAIAAYAGVYIAASFHDFNINTISSYGDVNRGSESTAVRFLAIVGEWNLFIQSPLIGVNFGSVYPLIGVLNPYDGETGSFGGSTITYILAGCGLVGFSLFVSFIYCIIYKLIQLAKKCDANKRYILIGIILSTIALILNSITVEHFFKTTNWFHFGVICAVIKAYGREVCNV